MTSFFIYILECADKSYYVGHTNNVEERIRQHEVNEFISYTSSRLPIKLIFVQEFMTRDEAFLMERKLKGWSRAKKEALMRGDFETISKLARNKSKRATII